MQQASAASLLASCSEDIQRLEQIAARDLSASEELANLLRARVATSDRSGLSSRDSDEKDASSSSEFPDGPKYESTGSEKTSTIEKQVSSAASSLIPAMIQDNVMLECNIRDYNSALQAALDDLFNTKNKVVELDLVQCEGSKLEQIIRQERDAQQCLRKENLILEERLDELGGVLQKAMAAEDDEVGESLIELLAAENSALRAMLFSRSDGAGAPGTPLRARSISSRASPSSQSHGRASSTGSSPGPDALMEFHLGTLGQGCEEGFPTCEVPPMPPMPPPSPPSEHREVNNLARHNG